MTRIEQIKSHIQTLLEPIVAEQGVVVVDFSVRFYRTTTHLVLIIDLPLGGIGIEECSAVNRALVNAIDLDGLLGEDYTLEVSSPGLDRPLHNRIDFQRCTNRTVTVYLTEKFEGSLELTGKIQSVTESELVLIGKEEELTIPLSVITKGIQDINYATD